MQHTTIMGKRQIADLIDLLLFGSGIFMIVNIFDYIFNGSTIGLSLYSLRIVDKTEGKLNKMNLFKRFLLKYIGLSILVGFTYFLAQIIIGGIKFVMTMNDHIEKNYLPSENTLNLIYVIAFIIGFIYPLILDYRKHSNFYRERFSNTKYIDLKHEKKKDQM